MLVQACEPILLRFVGRQGVDSFRMLLGNAVRWRPGRVAKIKPDLLRGQPNKLNFSRRLAPSPPFPPPKSNVDVITRVLFFFGMRRAVDLQHCSGEGGQLLQQKVKLSLLVGWFFWTIFGRGDV